MAKVNGKKNQSSTLLETWQTEHIARLIIGQTVREVQYGTCRKERIAAPSGTVAIF